MCPTDYKEVQNTHHFNLSYVCDEIKQNKSISFRIPPNTDFNNVSKNCILTLRSVNIKKFNKNLSADRAFIRSSASGNFGINFVGMGVRTNQIVLFNNQSTDITGKREGIIMFPLSVGDSDNNLGAAGNQFSSVNWCVGNNNLDIKVPCSNPFGKEINIQLWKTNQQTKNIQKLIIPNATNAVAAHHGAAAVVAALVPQNSRKVVNIQFDITFIEPKIDQNF